jgi:hypothetical protein
VPEQAPRPDFTFPKTVCAPLHTLNPHPTANRFSSRHHSSAQDPSKSPLKSLFFHRPVGHIAALRDDMEELYAENLRHAPVLEPFNWKISV